MIALILILSFAALFVWAIVSDCRKDKRDQLKLEQDSKNWLEEQNKLPKYLIRVLTKTGKIYESEVMEPTSEVKASLRYYISYWTSLHKAYFLIEESIKFGRYCHAEENLFIPLCEIESLSALVAYEGGSSG